MASVRAQLRTFESRILPRLERAVVGVLAIVILAIVTLHIGARIAGESLPWTEEAARLGTIWAVFLSVPLFVRWENLISLRLLLDIVPPRAQEAFQLLNSVTIAVVMVALAKTTAPIVVRDWARATPGLHWPTGLFTLPVLLMALLSLVHVVPIIYKHAELLFSSAETLRSAKQESAPDPTQGSAI